MTSFNGSSSPPNPVDNTATRSIYNLLALGLNMGVLVWRGTAALLLTTMILTVSWLPTLSDEAPSAKMEEPEPVSDTVLNTQTFTTTQGFSLVNLTLDPVTGLTTLKRPSMSWITPGGMGLASLRTGACSAYLPSTNEVFLIGGRVDVDPTQTGDEASTKMVEIFDVANKTWAPSTQDLKQVQQYHGCAVAGGKIYAVGDYYPFASPSMQSSGLVQVYDPAQGNWSYGTSMPGNRSVGLAGVAEHGGMIYVAGGVTAQDRSDVTDRLMRYDPNNDTWTQLASMNNRRHSFDLVSFKGKLIAYGGVATYFDPQANTTVEGDSNLTEAYDPITNTWTQLPNATHHMSAYAAEVYNDEIIIHGGYEQVSWQGTANDKTYGYDPFNNQWTTYATLQTGMYDSTLVRANDTLVYASGDSSTIRFGTWSMQYLAENEYSVNPTERNGLLTSPIQDLKSGQHGAASLLWLSFSTIEPADTTLGLQYRTAQSLQGIASASWLPTTVPVNTYLSAGNTSLTSVLEDAPYLQYRVRYATTNLMDWVTPTLLEVSVGADSVSFGSSLPAYMQPTSAPLTISTQHHAVTNDGTYTLQLHPSNSLGGLAGGASWMKLIWNSTTSSLMVEDPDGLLFGQATVTLGPDTANGQSVNWTFSLGGNMPSDYLRVKTTTHAQRNVTYLHPDIVSIDRNVTVAIDDVRADASSQGDESLAEGEVIPGNTKLNITLEHYFTNSGLALLGGNIQARLHMDMETYDTDAFGQRIWANESSQWFNLPSGQLYHAMLNVPETLSGEVALWLEARTSEDWDLTYSTEPWNFIVNSNGPTLLSLTPALDSYINENAYRTISFVYHDIGGFTNETFQSYAWLEGRDDGTNGEPKDGIAQRAEYQPAPNYIQQSGNRWTVNITVDDTVNADHQWGRVLLEGYDIAGFPIPAAAPNEGHARWESRTPTKSHLVSFEPTKNLLSDTLMRFEPSQEVGWSLVVEDLNGLSDIMEVRFELGNDDNLGVKYTVLDNTCESLDERLQVLPTGCVVDTSKGVLELEITAKVEWSLTETGLIQGEVDVFVKDYDGTQRFDYSEAWVLERALSITMNSLRDDDGGVVQSVSENSVVMSGDRLNLSASVSHLTSATPYNGELRLRWDGMIQNQQWKGGATVALVDGLLLASISTPELSGLVHDLTLTLWDPLELEQLSSYDVVAFRIDHQPPVLLPSSILDTISRYHLDNVQIGVNIDEEQGWSSPLTLTCQVRSMTLEWDPVTLVRNATTVFNGNTMFSFTFDFSQMGDPSLLSPQATLACWALGHDDAGWALTSDTGNSALDPWLEAPLNNIGPDLSLENVEISPDIKAGEKVRLSFFVVNGGEGLTTPFNASIELVQGDQRTLVGRSIFSSMDQNTAKSVKRSFTAPEGEWTLEITVDLEQQIWEIDETNNVYTKKFTTNSGGFAAVLVLSGVGLLAILGATVVLRKRSETPVEESKLVAAISATTDAQVPPAVSPAVPPAKQRGPPGGKIASHVAEEVSNRPTKGPPRKPPTTKTEPAPEQNLSPQAMAAQYLDALGAPPVEASTNPNHAEDYSKLPGGGEYEYTPEATYYVGETCGRWILNEDKSFTRLPEVA
jgi:N-acetylneuraminic acid mutarotase